MTANSTRSCQGKVIVIEFSQPIFIFKRRSVWFKEIYVPKLRYILLRDMVKDATHHPDYKVST